MKYLASVGTAQLFRVDDGIPRLIATARTLTESSLTFSSESKEIVAGAGETLAGQFVGRSRLKIDLTEVNFNLDYISSFLMSTSPVTSSKFHAEEVIVDSEGKVQLLFSPQKMGTSFGLDKYVVLYRLREEDAANWHSLVITESQARDRYFSIPGTKYGDSLCVRYFGTSGSIVPVLIGGNFFPAEVQLILTTKIIYSSTDRVEDGQVAGEIVFRIPRYKLDANFNLAVAMSSFGTVPISGYALAYIDESDPFTERYGEVIENGASTRPSSVALKAIVPNVTEIGIMGLYTDGSLVELPIVEIPSDIFNSSLSLQRVELPSYFTVIAEGAFDNCPSVWKLVLPFAGINAAPNQQYTIGSIFGTTHYIGFYEAEQYYGTPPALLTFYVPNLLTQIQINGEKIPLAACMNCTSLCEVILDDSVVCIEDFAFKGCSSLSTFVFPESVSILGASILEGCVGLTAITFSAGSAVTSLGGSFFKGCSGLLSVTLPEGLCSLSTNLLTGCDQIKSISVPFLGASMDDTNQFLGYLFGASSPEGQGSLIPPSLTTVVLTRILAISATTFSECDNLKELFFSQNLETMGQGALSACTSLEKLTIPFVGESRSTSNNFLCYAFGTTQPAEFNGDNLALKEVVVTGEPETLASYAFYGFSTVQRFQLPRTLASVGSSAFFGCTALESIEIPDSVTGLGSSAFSGCSSLTSITIPDSVTSIGESAFYDCSSLTSVIIGDSVTSIGESAFYDCSSLTSVTIPDSVTSIGGGAFSGCASLTSITIPFVGSKAGITASSTFQYPLGYLFGTSSYTGGVATEQYYYGSSASSTTSSTYYIPVSLTSVTVTGGYIPYGAFYNCSNLISVVLGDDVTSIGGFAFFYCTSLTSIAIPGSVTRIGDQVFYNCSALTAIEIPESVTSIGGSAFYGCSSLASVTIGSGVTSIGGSAFYGCSSLASVTIGSGVTSIEEYAFYGCSSLASIEIPDGVTSIGIRAFSDCDSLTSISIPDSVTSIGDAAFYNCSSLASVEIPDGVTSIRESVFRGCTSLTSVEIPDSVTSIGDAAFSGCTSLTSIEIPDSVSSIGGSAFYGCSALEYAPYDYGDYLGNTANPYLVLIRVNTRDPSAVVETLTIHPRTKVIADYTCSEYTDLESVVFNDVLHHIGEGAFQYCEALSEITLPETVESIGDLAFFSCNSLNSITVYAFGPPTLGSDVFEDTNDCPIYIYSDSVEKYQNATNWASYSDRFQVIPD